MNPIPRRHIAPESREVVGRWYRATPDERRIVEDVLREAGVLRSLAWVEQRARHGIPDQRLFVKVTRDLEAIVSGMWHPHDDRFWLHVSAVGRSTTFPPVAVLPTWDQLREIKQTFIGDERRAYQVLPRASEYVNLHPATLHLWCCLTEDVIPDFADRGSI